MKPGMKPDNFQQIYEKGMKAGMKPRYETGLSENIFPHIGSAPSPRLSCSGAHHFQPETR